MKSNVYEQLFLINSAFEQVIRSLDALKKYRQFHAEELARFRLLSRENRASVNSYLTAAIESFETDQAGRLFGKRRAQERRDEKGDAL